MTNRCLPFIGALAVVIVASLVAPAPVAGQAAPSAAKPTASANTWTLSRTPDGQPDLQGIWNYATMVPLERPIEFAGKRVLTDDEAAEFEAKVTQRLAEGNFTGQMPSGTYNLFWRDPGRMSTRTSLIVDPPDGRVPPLTPEAQKRTARAGRGFNSFDSYEDRPLGERCLSWGTAGPPMVPGPYNSNVQLLQTPGYVVIFNEMIHEHRIVPLDGRSHVGQTIRQWMGDSRGRWEGNTLVVESTNFTNKTSFRGASEQMRLIERFTRVDADALNYEFTVEDPTSFTRPWTARIPMTKTEDLIYEYACHEGNYSMMNGLSGARDLEKVGGRTSAK